MARLAPLLLAAALAQTACSSSSETTTVGGTTVSTQSGDVGVGGSLGGISAGIGTATITAGPPPTAEDRRVQPLLGSWTLARAGDRVCTVDLGSRGASGDYTAKTRRCASVELARIAFWQPLPDGIALIDFERRPVVTLRSTAPGIFEGPLGDGVRLTLWR